MGELVKKNGAVLARRSQRAGRGPLAEYLAFTVADDAYAVPIGLVREILKPPPLAEVPRAPRHVLGVASVRGLLVTVVDLRILLRLDPASITRKSRLLLVEGLEGELIGLLVDEVRQVHRLAESEIETSSHVLSGQLAEHVIGIGRPEGELVIIVDLRPLIEELGELPSR